MEQKNKLNNELLGLEKKFWQAMKDNDVDTAVGLTDFPCLIAGARGIARVDKESFVGMMKKPSHTIESFRFDDKAEVRMVSDDVAVLAYKVHEDITIDGKALSIDAAESSTWVRRNGKWACALHTESLQGDPYGRDRQPGNASTR